MKNYVLTIALYVFIIGNGLVFGQISIKNPEITPLSPEAARMARYGDMDLTGATGQMRYSIPIYNIDVDGHSWPVALNYNYGGLILESKPSLSGLGWQLSGYASITKEARGLPDGHPEGYYGDQGVEQHINLAVNDYLDNGTFDQISFHDLSKFKDGYWDSEVDKYTLNVNGQTMGFKVIKDDNGEMDIYYLSRHNYKIKAFKDITQVFEVASFEVTDDTGVKYIFNAEHRERVNEDPVMFTKFWEDKTTAWMLSEIQYGNGQSIVFNYDSNAYVSYNFSANGYENDLDASTVGQTLTELPVQNWSIGYTDKIHEIWMTRMILTSIEFPKGKIELETTNAGRKLFTDLVLKDHNNSIIDTYEFTYMGARDALINIQKNGERYYSFDYFGVNTGGLPVPGFFDNPIDKPLDQDYWKYYNNANNSRAIHLPFDGEYANKLPNFSATRVGALKRITYATGGYTEIDYEQNTVKTPYENSPGSGTFTPNQEEFLSVHAKLDNNERTASATITFDYPMRAVLFHKIRGNVISGNSIWMNIQRDSGPDLSTYYDASYWNGVSAVSLSQPYYPIIMDYARNFILEDEDNPFYPYPFVAPQLIVELDPDNHCPWYNGNAQVVAQPDDNFPDGQSLGGQGSTFSNFCVSETEIDMVDDSGGIFWIAPGTYTFSIQVGTDNSPLLYDDIFAEIGIRWEDPAIANDETLPEFVNKYVGGIRVKKTTDYTSEDNYVGVKHYDYNDDEGFSTARLNQTPYTKNEHLWYISNLQQNDNGEEVIISSTKKLDEYLLNSYTAANLNHGIPVYYSRIKTFKTASPNNGLSIANTEGDDTPNGYVIQEYFLPAETIDDQYPVIPLGQDVTKAVPSIKRIKDANNYTISSENITYNLYRWNYVTQHPVTSGTTTWDENPEHPWSFKYYKKLVNYVYFNQNGCDYDFDTANDQCLKALHDIKPYKEADKKRLVREITSQYSGVTTKKKRSYDAKLLLQEEETSVIDIVDELDKIRVEYDYPYEVAETAYQNMHNYTNQVNNVVQQRTYKDGVLTSQSKIDFAASNSYYRPKAMFSAKGTHALQKEIEFDYDPYGNILSYVNNDGASVPTTFVWGYNKTVPVAKIVNATPQDVYALIDQVVIQNLDGPSLESALQVLRTQLPNAQVTTYAYNPLIGVESITDPLGQTLYYTYDQLNRLKLVKDKNHKVIEEYDFNYRVDPLTATLYTTSEELYLNQYMNCTVGVEGGTGNFTYAWTVTNDSTGAIILQQNSSLNALNIGPATSAFAPAIKVSCVITDTQINQSITVERTYTTHNTYAPLTVNEISKAGLAQVGSTMQFTIGASGGSGNYSYHWRKEDSNGIEVNYSIGNQTSLTYPVVANDCSYFTMYCTVTDIDSGVVINKSITVNVTGCTGGSN